MQFIFIDSLEWSLYWQVEVAEIEVIVVAAFSFHAQAADD